ncbi:SusF/SusE family outer membrane protein [Prevotella sp. E13-17]|uniref:SusF/SusE family outer membrane protein n=1 Tax=Prevotella sp. E13-17 TaxID=2913616 RepID=UPI001EDC3C34|nr:SusF/SusE family outer membrane protein [Prevotella sp. E13-17]UKK51159.1 SusF/SusE family outer membrane protein [Prevotella sp. E13-17]
MKKIQTILFLIALLLPSAMAAQDFTALWITGSAVPEGTQQLVKQPNGNFAFKGALNVGEVKVMTTATYQEGVTQFLKPQLTDSYLINNGLYYVTTKDASQPGWVVSFQEDLYHFVVLPGSKKLQGELFFPWNELLIAGSAIPNGADNTEWKRDNMLPFVRDHENPYIFTWEGELGIYNNVVEPGYFKLEGQMTWGPRELHPYQHGEDILNSQQVCIGGNDNKWKVSKNGRYRITVNLYDETVHAEMVPASSYQIRKTLGISTMDNETESPATVYDLNGMKRTSLSPGLNIIRRTDGRIIKVAKRRYNK